MILYRIKFRIFSVLPGDSIRSLFGQIVIASLYSVWLFNGSVECCDSEFVKFTGQSFVDFIVE